MVTSTRQHVYKCIGKIRLPIHLERIPSDKHLDAKNTLPPNTFYVILHKRTRKKVCFDRVIPSLKLSLHADKFTCIDHNSL